MHLGHLIVNFQREKVTVDQIRKLYSEEMEPESYRSFDVDAFLPVFDSVVIDPMNAVTEPHPLNLYSPICQY